MRTGTVLPHKTEKLAILTEWGLKFRKITCTKEHSYGFISLNETTEKNRTKIFCALKVTRYKSIYSTSICVLKCTKNMKTSSIFCPIIMALSVHFLIRSIYPILELLVCDTASPNVKVKTNNNNILKNKEYCEHKSHQRLWTLHYWHQWVCRCALQSCITHQLSYVSGIPRLENTGAHKWASRPVIVNTFSAWKWSMMPGCLHLTGDYGIFQEIVSQTLVSEERSARNSSHPTEIFHLMGSQLHQTSTLHDPAAAVVAHLHSW